MPVTKEPRMIIGDHFRELLEVKNLSQGHHRTAHRFAPLLHLSS
jgi:hypothetical protein